MSTGRGRDHRQEARRGPRGRDARAGGRGGCSLVRHRRAVAAVVAGARHDRPSNHEHQGAEAEAGRRRRGPGVPVPPRHRQFEAMGSGGRRREVIGFGVGTYDLGLRSVEPTTSWRSTAQAVASLASAGWNRQRWSCRSVASPSSPSSSSDRASRRAWSRRSSASTAAGARSTQCGVLGLQHRRQPPDLAEGERWQAATHLRAACGPGEPAGAELAAAGDGAGEGAAGAAVAAEAECGGALVEVESDSPRASARTRRRGSA